MYSIAFQIKILQNCNTATELVTARELLENVSCLSDISFSMFNLKLNQLFLIDKI